MNARQQKETDSYLSVQLFLEKHAAQMIAATPNIADNIAQYNTLYLAMEAAIIASNKDLKGFKTDVDGLRTNCETGLWKLYLAVHYRHKSLNDKLTLIKVRMTQSALKQKSPMEFYNYAQVLFELYVPADYEGLGIVETETDALKLLCTKYINKVDEATDARITKRLALQKLTSLLKEIPAYLEDHLDSLARISLASDVIALDAYNNSRYKGFVSATRGNPDKKGKLGPGQTVVLDKHTYRTKKVIIVINAGKAQLKAGIGLTATAFTGTPFTIEPGKMRRRISQKLAKEGEYILLQNVGDVETEYKVWMGE